jgi:hypothetical protein
MGLHYGRGIMTSLKKPAYDIENIFNRYHICNAEINTNICNNNYFCIRRNKYTSLSIKLIYMGVRSGAVCWGTKLQAGRQHVRVPLKPLNFCQCTWSFLLRYRPGVYSASKRNEYHKIFQGVKRGRRIRLTISPPSMSRLSRQYRIIHISTL